jgi:hypothetical protein
VTRSPDQVLADLLAAAEEADLPAALIGGYAVVTWAIPRATLDVDLLLEGDDQRLARCFASLERRGFGIDDSYRKGWRDHVRDMPLVKVQTFLGGRSVTGDLFLVTTPLQQSAFARTRIIQVPGIPRAVRVVSPADLLLFKLLADRRKDRLDVQNILTVQGVPDPGYLREWATKLGLSGRLEAALAEAGLRPT